MTGGTERDRLDYALLVLRNTVGDLRNGFARSVDPSRWVDQVQAQIDAAIRLNDAAIAIEARSAKTGCAQKDQP